MKITAKCNSQVSRDERNEYHGISLEQAPMIMDLFHVRLEFNVELEKVCEGRKSFLRQLLEAVELNYIFLK